MLNDDREALRKVISRTAVVEDVTRYNSGTAAVYTEQPFASTSLTKIARMLFERSVNVGGIANNKGERKIAENEITNANKYIITNTRSFEDVVDDAELTFKRKYGVDATVYDTQTAASAIGGAGGALTPVSYFSSSVTTGYAKVLPAGLDVNGLHFDRTYDPSFGAPMQSPFTQQHVGGQFHRHIAFNTGSEGRATRGEAFSLNYQAGVGIVISQSVNRNLPHLSAYMREEFAKRPVNIRNIKTTSRLAGNYQKDHEVVQTAGRDVNNTWFIQSNAAISASSISSPYYIGLNDFVLPNRSKRDHVFVEHFSSPGGPEQMSRGFLDTESETHSPYTGVNYRNLDSRETLTALQSHHMSGGYDGIYGSPTASFHKTCKNTNIHKISGSSYDNWFVQRPIPASDTGYSWIRYSYLSASWSTLLDPSIEE